MNLLLVTRVRARAEFRLTFRKCCKGFVLAALFWGVSAAPRACAQESSYTNQLIPLIVMDNVPLADAIRNLARQAGINYILDPRLSGSADGPDGKAASVNARWENITAEQALSRVLSEHKLAIVQSQSAPVARITYTNQVIPSAVGSQSVQDTNRVMPLIVMDEVPLEAAIQNLARQSQLQAVFDAKLSEAMSAHPVSVSIRWENLTARQALNSLLENYDLVKVEDAQGSVRISPKTAEVPAQEPVK